MTAFAVPDTLSYERQTTKILKQLDADQIALLEKINRADRQHLSRQPALIVPSRFDLDELSYSPLPLTWDWATPYEKILVVHQPSQVFGAYEYGALVRWGPVSSGKASDPTPTGLFHLNWRARSRRSTIDETWLMNWYFNFHSKRGLAFHQYTLPGRPASHACVRLLERDAIWLYQWGDEWTLSEDGQNVLKEGTPVLIIGNYDFSRPRPWLNPAWWETAIALPNPS